MKPAVRRKRVRRLAFGVSSAVALLLALGLAGLPVYVFPPTDDVSNVDAVVVLGPAYRSRLVAAENISDRNGHIPILISVAPTGPRSAANIDLCANTNVICKTPRPYTTAGEAALASLEATANGWATVAVVTSRPHSARAAYIFSRCFVGTARMFSTPFNGTILDWAGQYLYQTSAFIKAATTSCSGTDSDP